MENEREPRPADRTKESSGEYLWRVLRPAGCIAVLLLFIAFLVFCFTWRGDAPSGTAAPRSVEAAETAARE